MTAAIIISVFKFQKLEVWEKSVRLGKLCFEVAEQLPQKYQFSFGDRKEIYKLADDICKMLTGLIRRRK